MFYLDLDELDMLHKKLLFFSRNQFNWFSFYDKQRVVEPSISQSLATKRKILDFIYGHGVETLVSKVMLLTNVSVFGYNFNPISVYLCFDDDENAVCAVAEVCNTHREMKLYLLDNTSLQGDTFDLTVPKLFYVSPFVKMDSSFRFIFNLPDDKLHFRVDDYEQGRRFFLSSLTGYSKKLTDWNLVAFGVRFPFIPIRIVTLIHWQAILLWLKRIPFKRKQADLHLQQNMFHYK